MSNMTIKLEYGTERVISKGIDRPMIVMEAEGIQTQRYFDVADAVDAFKRLLTDKLGAGK